MSSLSAYFLTLSCFCAPLSHPNPPHKKKKKTLIHTFFNQRVRWFENLWPKLISIFHNFLPSFISCYIKMYRILVCLFLGKVKRWWRCCLSHVILLSVALPTLKRNHEEMETWDREPTCSAAFLTNRCLNTGGHSELILLRVSKVTYWIMGYLEFYCLESMFSSLPHSPTPHCIKEVCQAFWKY